MNKPAKKARKIIVNKIEYWWKITRSKFILWGDDFKKVVDLSTFTGWDWESIERGTWKRYFSIKPSYVSQWIKENINTLG